MKVRCPRCKALYQVAASRVPDKGAYGRCVRCGTRFRVTAKSNNPPVPGSRLKPRPPARTNPPKSPQNHRKPGGYRLDSQCYAGPTPMESARTDSRFLPKVPVSMHRWLRERFQRILPHLPYRMLAVDLGTANTLIYNNKKGILLNESSVVAMRADPKNGKQVLAVGADAKKMMGRTPEQITAIRPMQDGVIADFEVAGAMLSHFIGKVRKGFCPFGPKVLIAVPSGITPVEKRAVRESAKQAGAREVFLIAEPMAAAIGAGLPVHEPVCNLVVDIGGGTTEVAVIALGGIVAARSLRVAGDKMDQAIVRYVRKQYNFVIGETTAEDIKMRIGNARPADPNPEQMAVKGWEFASGRPRVFTINALEIKSAISEQLEAIVESVKIVLDQISQELSADVVDRGILLTGGMALLQNLDRYLARQTGLPVTRADDPLSTVVMGTGIALDRMERYQGVLIH